MKIRAFAIVRTLVTAAVVLSASSIAFSQSSDVDFPTPVISNTISGKILARDIGDGRSTTYYFAFDGEQGDIFINVVTKNLDADIDVFAVEGMRPLTKMVVYSDSATSETGRLVYLRKPEKMLLRIQGRTPNDDAGTYQVKFTGSFVALSDKDAPPPAPKVLSASNNDVNTVGTIIAKPQQRPTPRIEPSADDRERNAESKNTVTVTKPAEPQRSAPSKPAVAAKDTSRSRQAPAKRSSKTPSTPVNNAGNGRSDRMERTKDTASKKPETADPLANVRLVIVMKDGTRTEVRMPDLLRFNVDRGTLTVIRKNGQIERYQMVDVSKVTIE